jgi:hypothetical protein
MLRIWGGEDAGSGGDTEWREGGGAESGRVRLTGCILAFGWHICRDCMISSSWITCMREKRIHSCTPACSSTISEKKRDRMKNPQDVAREKER